MPRDGQVQGIELLTTDPGGARSRARLARADALARAHADHQPHQLPLSPDVLPYTCTHTRTRTPRADAHALVRPARAQAIRSNPSFITLRKIEAAREVASTISTGANRVYLNSDSLLLNLGDLETDPSKKR